MRKLNFVSLVALLVAGLIIPGTSASAASPYDASTSQNLRSMYNVMASYYYYGPTGSFEGVTEQGLRDQGWSKPADLRIEIWVEGTGHNFSATAQDRRGGSQYSVTASGSFNGNGAGAVGPSESQPTIKSSIADFTVHDLNSSLDAAALAALLLKDKVAMKAICDATLAYPGTHQAGSSVSDQTLACQAALWAPNATMQSVILALRTNGGAAMLAAIALDFVGDGSQPAAAPPWVVNNQPRPTTGQTPSATLPALWRLPKLADQFAPEETPAVRAIVLTQCVQLVGRALVGNPQNLCKELPIFSSGQSDVPEATNHDLEALIKVPGWVKLDHRLGADNPSYEGWYKGRPECANSDPDLQCDEYPFYATVQGGGKAIPTPDMKLIDGLQNKRQGELYKSFLSACNFYSAAADDKAFLAIPVPATFKDVPTLAVCNGK